MKRRIISLFIAFALIIPPTISAGSANTPAIPNTWSNDFFTIGFFNFVDDRGTHLEFRLNNELSFSEWFTISVEEYLDIILPGTSSEYIRDLLLANFKQRDVNEISINKNRVEINQPYTISGITRIRETSLNVDAVGGPAAGASTHDAIVFNGWITTDYGFKTDAALMQAQVDGTGTVTFGEGVLKITIGNDEYSADLSGLVLSNKQICCNGDCLIGDVNNDGIVTVNDALEILKYLAELRNEVDRRPIARVHSTITPESKIAGVPSMNDALEILKALSGLPSQVTRLKK